MTIWYTARGAGLSALIMLTLATAAGALVSAPIRSAAHRVVVQYVHRTAAVMGLGLLALHIGAILADSYAGVGWVGALVPFASGYAPGRTALGVLAVYLFLLVAGLGATRRAFTGSPAAIRVWRWLHSLSYLAWGISALHGFTIGSDSSLAWVRWIYLGCVATVAVAVGLRIAAAKKPRRPARLAPTPSPTRLKVSL